MAARKKLTGTVLPDNGLNLRRGPHISFTALAILPMGEKLTLLALPDGINVEGWLAVKSEKHGAGWVMSRFLEVESDDKSVS